MNRLFAQRYRLLRPLGSGAMGRVDLAEDTGTGARVALKRLLPRWTQDPRFRARFQREARIAHTIQQANIVRTYDFGERDGVWYLVCEFVDGRDLARLVAERGTLAERQALTYTADVLRALVYLYEDAKRVVHRDIKPANILITKDGRAKLCDFGLARATAIEGSLATLTDPRPTTMGTAAYIAPEQIDFNPEETKLDCRCDLFSVGAMLFQLLSGRPPFYSRNHVITIMKHSQLDLPAPRLRDRAPHITRACSELVQHLLQKKREDRPPEPAQVLNRVEAILDGLPNAGYEPPGPRPMDPGFSAQTTGASPPGPLSTEQAEAPTLVFSYQHTDRSSLTGLDTLPPSHSQGPGKERGRSTAPQAQMGLARAALFCEGTGQTFFIYGQSRLQLGKNRVGFDGQDVCLRYRPATTGNNERSKLISGKHFVLESSVSGATVTDYSSGGTTIDGQRLSPEEPMALNGPRLLSIPGGLTLQIEPLGFERGAGRRPALVVKRSDGFPEHSYVLLPEGELIAFGAGGYPPKVAPWRLGDLEIAHTSAGLFFRCGQEGQSSPVSDRQPISIGHGLRLEFRAFDSADQP